MDEVVINKFNIKEKSSFRFMKNYPIIHDIPAHYSHESEVPTVVVSRTAPYSRLSLAKVSKI